MLREDSASQQEELMRTLALLQARWRAGESCSPCRTALCACCASLPAKPRKCVAPRQPTALLHATPHRRCHLQAAHKREEDLRRQAGGGRCM